MTLRREQQGKKIEGFTEGAIEYLETYSWPENIHNLTISGNGKYVFATQPSIVVGSSCPAFTSPMISTSRCLHGEPRRPPQMFRFCVQQA